MISKLNTQFLDKFCNLLVLLKHPKEKYGIRSIPKDAIYASKMLRIEGSRNLRTAIINQYCSTQVCNIIYWVYIDFDTVHMGKSIIQSIVWVRDKCIHSSKINLRSGFCRQNQWHYLMKKSILKSDPWVHFWPRQVLKHILLWLRNFTKTLEVVVHIVQWKLIPMKE